MNRVEKKARRLERSRRARKSLLCAVLALASVLVCGVFALGSTPSAPTIESVAPRAPGLNARKIKRVIRGVTDQIAYVSYGPATEPPLRCTPGHPFYVIDEGWVAAKDLRAGDRLSGTDGSPIPVRGVEVRAERAETYNLEVEEDHTYFVAASPTAPAVWVHNDCGKIAGTEGLEHSFGKHAKEWDAVHGGKLTREEWRALIEKACRSDQTVEWTTGPEKTKTVGTFARIDGNKPFFVQFFAEGPRMGELATAFIPSAQQIGEILAKLGKIRGKR